MNSITPTLFVFTITAYLVSIVSAMLLSFVHKKLNSAFGWSILIIHIMFGLMWLLTQMVIEVRSGLFNYFFVLYFCTGIILSSYWLWVRRHILIKIYSMIFLVSIIFFIISPSRVIGFVATGNYLTIDPERWNITQNYYLIEQEGIDEIASGHIRYKVVREMGFFHRTLKRNIDLPFIPERVELELLVKDSIIIFNSFNLKERARISVGLKSSPGKNEITRVIK